MKRCSLGMLPWHEVHSTTRKFHSFCRNVSLAMGGIRDVGLSGGGHPFDVQLRRIPAGAAAGPCHSHLAQSELFVVRTGHGTVRVGNETHPVKNGDAFYHPPGEAHQLINSGSTDLEVMIIADNPPMDACYYPDSNKWGLNPAGKIFRMTEVDYLDGEDVSSNNDQPAKSSSGPAPASMIPFVQRKTSIDDLPWETFDSPKKKFRGSSKQVSLALGAVQNTPTGLGGHPFDLEFGKIEPGQSGCPYHSHLAQWEFYIFVEGNATVRTAEGYATVIAGDVVLHPPGEAHQFTNTGNTDLLYLLIADNPSLDVWHYPDSNKWGINSPRKIFRATDADYWDGEE